MLDLRIYRAAFLPLIAAVVVVMFSLEPAPEPIERPVSVPTFEGSATARLARSIATVTPSREPGSEGDAALADRVLESFSAVTGGEAGVQSFEGEYEGDSVELENVLLTLPGRREEILLVVAGRNSSVGQGATTTAAATAVLMQLAEDLGSARHERTIVLASVPGPGGDSDGIAELVDGLAEVARIEAALAIANAGVEDRRPPFVFAGQAEAESIPATLIETANEAASVQFGAEAGSPDAWQQFARLAIPVGVGNAAALAEQGLDAVGISGSGERPPPPESALPEAISTETMLAVGGTALELLLTLDERTQPIEAGADAYVRIGDNLLPGWTVRVLALALILPALLAAGDAWLRERRRRPRAARRSLPWALERVLLPLVALLATYLLGFVGVISDPTFPYDPGQFSPGARGAVTFVALALAVAGVAALVRPMRTPLDAEPQGLAAAGGLLCGAAVLGIWLQNPFIGLLLAPVAHVWLLPARPQSPPAARVVAAVAGLALLPALAAAAQVVSSFELSVIDAPWHLLLLIVSGQIGLLTSLLWCLLLGGLLACVAASRGGVVLARGSEPVRGPADHAGPGALGGPSSSLSRN